MTQYKYRIYIVAYHAINVEAASHKEAASLAVLYSKDVKFEEIEIDNSKVIFPENIEFSEPTIKQSEATQGYVFIKNGV